MKYTNQVGRLALEAVAAQVGTEHDLAVLAIKNGADWTEMVLCIQDANTQKVYHVVCTENTAKPVGVTDENGVMRLMDNSKCGKTRTTWDSVALSAKQIDALKLAARLA